MVNGYKHIFTASVLGTLGALVACTVLNTPFISFKDPLLSNKLYAVFINAVIMATMFNIGIYEGSVWFMTQASSWKRLFSHYLFIEIGYTIYHFLQHHSVLGVITNHKMHHSVVFPMTPIDAWYLDAADFAIWSFILVLPNTISCLRITRKESLIFLSTLACVLMLQHTPLWKFGDFGHHNHHDSGRRFQVNGLIVPF